MKHGWVKQNIGSIISLEYGKPLSRERRCPDGKYPAYGANGIRCRTNDCYWKEPSIIVGRKGSAGEIKLVEEGFWPLDVTYFITFDKTKYDLKFLYFLLYQMNLPKLAKGVKPGINRNDVYAMDSWIPPLPEQKRIIAILDEAFSGIEKVVANTEKNLANIHEFFDSYLHSLYWKREEKWNKKKLGEVCENLDSKRVPITKSKRKPGKIPYYGASGVVDYVEDYLFDEDLLLVSEDGANLLARTYPIAFSISGKSWVNNHAHVLRFEDFESQKFIEYFLNSISLAPYVSGMAQPKLNQKALNSIPVPFPDIKTQHEVVEKLDEMSDRTKKICEIYEQKLTALTELKQSLLQKAFSGELTAEPQAQIKEAAA